MIDQALALAREQEDPGLALNLLREYLQSLVLRSLHESEAFRALAFVGGTALRFLHGLPRFSQDLDFSLLSGDGQPPSRSGEIRFGTKLVLRARAGARFRRSGEPLGRATTCQGGTLICPLTGSRGAVASRQPARVNAPELSPPRRSPGRASLRLPGQEKEPPDSVSP